MIFWTMPACRKLSRNALVSAWSDLIETVRMEWDDINDYSAITAAMLDPCTFDSDTCTDLIPPLADLGLCKDL